jgi:threonine dehydrogenase-like Zn-dependent dehydrogenase
MKARAFWVEAPRQGSIRDEVLRAPGPGEVLVRMVCSGISRGTESLVFGGGVPIDLFDEMRCPHQAGELSLPVKYGYIAVGVIEAGSGTVGQEVFCMHPHQTHFVVPATSVIPLPPGLPAARAVLAPNLETALNGMWDGELGGEERISIIGAGVVGLLLGWLLKVHGHADVELIDINPAREDTARALGLSLVLPGEARTERSKVFHTSGSPAGLETALRLCGNEAEIIELSWFGDQPVSVPLGAQFHSRRLTIRASQVGQVAPSHRAEWTHRRRMDWVLEHLAEHPELDVLIDGESALEDLPQTMLRLASPSSGVLCHRVRY